MKNYILLLAISWLCLAQTFGQSAQEIVARCLEAHGGKDKIESIRYLKTSYIRHTNLVEQSERPTGPFIHEYQTGDEIIDVKNQQLQCHTKTLTPLGLAFGGTNWNDSEYRYSNGLLVGTFNERWFPVGALSMDYKDQFSYSPEQVLLQLDNAQSLKLEGKERVQGVENWKIQVQSRDRTFTVFINSFTNMLTAVEYYSAYKPEEYFFWSFWGDYPTQVYYSSFTIFPPGILYPLQIDVVKYGWDYRSLTFTALEFNPMVSDTVFNIPQEVREAAPEQIAAGFKRLSWQATQPEEVAPGITLNKGAWNVSFVEQKDGIVIIEAPISSSYCEQAIQAARQQFPGKQIKAVITTSDAWPHLSGLRQYVFEKIPIYALDLNQPIIDKLLKANFKTYPDALATSPQKSIITWVNQKITLKDEQLPIEIYPIHGEGGERMLMVYFPKQQVLYASDLVQKNSRTGTFYMPGYLIEVQRAAQREGLTVKKVFAMHTAPTEWSEMVNAINNQMNK